MRTALAIAIGCLIFGAMIASFSDALWPGFEAGKTTVVGIIFFLMAIAGLFHRFHKLRSDD